MKITHFRYVDGYTFLTLEIGSEDNEPSRPARLFWKAAGFFLACLPVDSFRWLGYYLSGGGKKRNGKGRRTIDKAVRLHYAYQEWTGQWNYGRTNSTFSLYRRWWDGGDNMLGKFLTRESSMGLHILDRYMFYPTCIESGVHTSECGCTQREWNKATQRLKVGRLYLTVKTYDKYWASLGTPFYTTAFYTEEELYAYALRRELTMIEDEYREAEEIR